MRHYELLNGCRAVAINIGIPALPPGIYSAPIVKRVGVVSYAAHRIWEEKDGAVTFYKNRLNGTAEQNVDLEEFTWIKLQAKPL